MIWSIILIVYLIGAVYTYYEVYRDTKFFNEAWLFALAWPAFFIVFLIALLKRG